MRAFSISLGIAFLLLLTSCSPTETVARLDAGGDAQIIVSADNSWEIARPYCYEVYRGDNIVVPRTFLGAGLDSDLSFQLVTSTDRRLVALIETHSPDVVLALFDLSTAETWPRSSDNDQPTSTHQRGVSLLSRLQLSHPATTFVLSHDVPGSRAKKL
jgi:hypothetical protein